MSAHGGEKLHLIVSGRHNFRTIWPVASLLTGLLACAPLGMTLPSDLEPPQPEGSRIKQANGWLTTERTEIAGGAPEGSIAISILRINGRPTLQQVRHYLVGEAVYGDSLLLDRTTLKPIETHRWTPAGEFVAKYNHRVVERTFFPMKGELVRSSETLDVEPYSALGMELFVASLPLNVGYVGVLPVAVDTARRGWAWLKFTVQREQQLQERRDQRSLDVWIVDCENGPGEPGLERTRLWIAIDGRSVRKIEHIDADNTVLGTLRRMLLPAPQRQSAN